VALACALGILAASPVLATLVLLAVDGHPEGLLVAVASGAVPVVLWGAWRLTQLAHNWVRSALDSRPSRKSIRIGVTGYAWQSLPRAQAAGPVFLVALLLAALLPFAFLYHQLRLPLLVVVGVLILILILYMVRRTAINASPPLADASAAHVRAEPILRRPDGARTTALKLRELVYAVQRLAEEAPERVAPPLLSTKLDRTLDLLKELTRILDRPADSVEIPSARYLADVIVAELFDMHQLTEAQMRLRRGQPGSKDLANLEEALRDARTTANDLVEDLQRSANRPRPER
jgi:hypothetical protein